jgi:hypothetical protein
MSGEDPTSHDGPGYEIGFGKTPPDTRFGGTRRAVRHGACMNR